MGWVKNSHTHTSLNLFSFHCPTNCVDFARHKNAKNYLLLLLFFLFFFSSFLEKKVTPWRQIRTKLWKEAKSLRSLKPELKSEQECWNMKMNKIWKHKEQEKVKECNLFLFLASFSVSSLLTSFSLTMRPAFLRRFFLISAMLFAGRSSLHETKENHIIAEKSTQLEKAAKKNKSVESVWSQCAVGHKQQGKQCPLCAERKIGVGVPEKRRRIVVTNSCRIFCCLCCRFDFTLVAPVPDHLCGVGGACRILLRSCLFDGAVCRHPDRLCVVASCRHFALCDDLRLCPCDAFLGHPHRPRACSAFPCPATRYLCWVVEHSTSFKDEKHVRYKTIAHYASWSFFWTQQPYLIFVSPFSSLSVSALKSTSSK